MDLETIDMHDADQCLLQLYERCTDRWLNVGTFLCVCVCVWRGQSVQTSVIIPEGRPPLSRESSRCREVGTHLLPSPSYSERTYNYTGSECKVKHACMHTQVFIMTKLKCCFTFFE